MRLSDSSDPEATDSASNPWENFSLVAAPVEKDREAFVLVVAPVERDRLPVCFAVFLFPLPFSPRQLELDSLNSVPLLLYLLRELVSFHPLLLEHVGDFLVRRFDLRPEGQLEVFTPQHFFDHNSNLRIFPQVILVGV